MLIPTLDLALTVAPCLVAGSLTEATSQSQTAFEASKQQEARGRGDSRDPPRRRAGCNAAAGPDHRLYVVVRG